MRLSKYLIIILVLGGAVFSCIDPFDPQIKTSDEKKYFIDAEVAAGDSIQRVHISETSPLEDPKQIPVDNCIVRMEDHQGNVFQFLNAGNGNYELEIPEAFLMPGRAFRLRITTGSGDILESAFDTIPQGAPVKSVYHQIESHERDTPGQYLLGVQFYMDIEGTPQSSRYYRIEPVETWEYHAMGPSYGYYDGTFHHTVPPDYSKIVCWRSLNIPSIFVVTTKNQVQNQFDRLPLHFVVNTTVRLAYGYSLLVRQHAINAEAYQYWLQLKYNAEQDGALYARQPFQIRGNIMNTTHPEKEVLGYFSAATVTSERIFVEPDPALPLNYNTFCDTIALRKPVTTLGSYLWPIYLVGTDNFLSQYQTIEKACVDCTALGGNIVKPDFWPH